MTRRNFVDFSVLPVADQRAQKTLQKDPSSNGGLLRSFGKRFLFVCVTLGLTLISTIVSFFTVQLLTRSPTEDGTPDLARQRQTVLLRAFATELTGACNAYAANLSRADNVVSTDMQSWIDRAFRRDIRFLEQRMGDNPMENLNPFNDLRAAVGRCASMARNPQDAALRKVALDDARRAIEGVHDFGAENGMTRVTGGRPSPVRF
jgi:hypothetical protein